MIVWLSLDVVEEVHERRLSQHGGQPGILNAGKLLAILNRPKNLLAYQEPDLADLAGCYAYGIATGHAFVDANKRTSLTATLAFIERNGEALRATERELWETWERLGAGQMTEVEISAWIRGRLVKLA